MNNQAIGAQYIHGSNSPTGPQLQQSSLTPSKGGGKGQNVLQPQGVLHGLNNLGLGSNLNANQNSQNGGPYHIGGNSSKTPKEAYKRIHGLQNNQNHDNRGGFTTDDRLNLSVDIVGRHGIHGQAASPVGGPTSSQNYINLKNRSQPPGYKKHSGQGRDYNLRMSRVNEDQLLSNSVNSVHDFNNKNKLGDLSMHEMSVQ